MQALTDDTMERGTRFEAFLRSTLKATSTFAMACLMLMFSTITKPARWICSCCRRPGNADDSDTRDVELGDLERERERNSSVSDYDRRGRSPTKRGRGTPPPDESEVYSNHWDKISMDSLMRPRSLRVPTPDGASSWSWDEDPDALDVDEVLPHPDAFDITAELERTTLAGTTAQNTPGVSLSADSAVSLRSVSSTLGLDHHHEEEVEGGDDTTGESKATTSATLHPSSSASSSAPSSTLPTFSGPLPAWLTAPKATAGPRASRFNEEDVDGSDIAPPDLSLIAEQRGPVGARARGKSWHAGQDGGREASGRACGRRSV
ncbi:hypothetical protein KVR01_000551 [Diaporthe batatas]|uniref:uncharacterized protein n=1 Tax=Diaporthe batatas TaxID=748121 RepID=UPI001D0404EC|nr:uncharacterized protein KVR01_000551 [Diaporthe batatas]KAG8169806.1 hypothetical protein KVR01_000551 [Diaporthe batatas]